MNHRHRFRPDLDQSRLESRILLAGTPPILPFLINGSTLGPYVNAGFAMFGMPGGGSSSMMGPGLTQMNSSGSLMPGQTATSTSAIPGVTSGATNPVVAMAFAAGAPVGSGANRAGGGAVGYGSRFASGYNFGLSATNAYGSSTSALGTNLPLGSSGVDVARGSSSPRNTNAGQRMGNNRLRFRELPSPTQDAPTDSQGTNGDTGYRLRSVPRRITSPRGSSRDR